MQFIIAFLIIPDHVCGTFFIVSKSSHNIDYVANRYNYNTKRNEVH